MLLVIARKYDPKFPSAIGGVIVSSENLIKFLDKNEIKYNLIDTNNKKYLNNLSAYYHIVRQILSNIKGHYHIAMNLNEREIIAIAPIVVVSSILLKKKVSLRVFGGNFNILYKKNFFNKYLINFVLRRADVTFLQTRFLVEKFPFSNIKWLPTCRYLNDFKMNVELNSERSYQAKFVFIGQIKKSKGVQIILNAFKKTEKGVVDFYGPLEDFIEADLNTKNSTYKGILKQCDVIDALSQYDFLVFPTIHSGEGYPGVIIESYAAGTPVISTDWMSIPEIVEHGKTGFLIEPNNTEALVKVLSTIDERRYENMRILAKDKFDEFDCDQVYGFYLKNLVRDS